jgi:hypothetical protein
VFHRFLYEKHQYPIFVGKEGGSGNGRASMVLSVVGLDGKKKVIENIGQNAFD